MTAPEVPTRSRWPGRGIFHLDRPELLTLLLIALIGATCIPEPFDGLQALFTMMARSLQHGATLYVNVWDVKQPGIFLFYEAAGRLFGFSEIGEHLFELAYQLLTAIVLIRLLRRELRHPVIASLGGFFALGGYYLSATSRHLGQIEGLVWLPMLLTIGLASQPAVTPGDRRTRMFLAGLTAGAVALFKLILAPLPACAWLVAYLARRSDEGTSIGAFVRNWALPAFGGTAVLLGGTALWALLHGGLSELLWTSFRYPILAVTESYRAPWLRLEESVIWFIESYWLLLLFALASGIGWRGWRRETIVLQAWAWLAMGVTAILAQKLSYWSYHFELLVPPVAILAARGCDGLLHRVDGLRARAHLLVPSLMAITIVVGSDLTLRRLVIASEVQHDPSPLAAYQDAVNPAYRELRPEVEFLDRPGARPGPIYVFGSPLVLWLGHREQAGAIQGWSWKQFIQQLWDRLPAQLATTRPVYVLVSHGYSGLIRRRSPRAFTTLMQRYRVMNRTFNGVWYERDDLARPPAEVPGSRP